MTGSSKPGSVEDKDNLQLTLAIIRQASVKPDWKLIAEELDIKSPAAARQRYVRLIAAMGGASPRGPKTKNGAETADTVPDTQVKSGGIDGEDGSGGDEPGTREEEEEIKVPTKKRKATAAGGKGKGAGKKQKIKDEVVDDDEDAAQD